MFGGLGAWMLRKWRGFEGRGFLCPFGAGRARKNFPARSTAPHRRARFAPGLGCICAKLLSRMGQTFPALGEYLGCTCGMPIPDLEMPSPHLRKALSQLGNAL